MTPIRIVRPTARRREAAPDRPAAVIRAFVRTLERLAVRPAPRPTQEGSR